jgi:carbon monoxide dehydrogenase subunit G
VPTDVAEPGGAAGGARRAAVLRWCEPTGPPDREPWPGERAGRGYPAGMASSSTQSITIAASPAEVAAVICDFAAYPQWTGAVKTCEVVEEYEDGYASQVRFVVDAGVFRDDYTLAYEYAEDASRIEWRLVAPSKAQRAQTGSYDLTPEGDGTLVTYSLAVDLAISLPGFLRRKAEQTIMDTALKELRKRVESAGAGRG